MHFTPLELERFRATATAIRDGSFDIKRDVVPPGYVNFCVLHADDPDPFLRYPLPPAFGHARTAPAKKPNQTRRGKRESGYLTRVIFDRFAADTATQRANASRGNKEYRRPGPYKPKGRNGGRNKNRDDHKEGRPKYFKNRSRDFRKTGQKSPRTEGSQAPDFAALDDPANDPFRGFHNLVPNVDDMFKELEINSSVDGSQTTPVASTTGPSTAATSPMNSISTD